MANYGPPDANHPDPWAGRRPEEAYRRRDEPRDRDRWDEPTGDFSAHPDQPWGTPTAGSTTGRAYQPGGHGPQRQPTPPEPWSQPPGSRSQPSGSAPSGPWPQSSPSGSWPQSPSRPDEPYRADDSHLRAGPYRSDPPPASGGYGPSRNGGYEYPPAGDYGQPPVGGYDRGGPPPTGTRSGHGGYPGGGHPDLGGQPGSGGYPGSGGHPPAGGYPGALPAYLSSGPEPSDAPPAERRRGRGRMVAVLAILTLLVLGGGAALFYLAGSDQADPVDALPSVTAVPSDAPSASAEEPAGASPSALAPESSADPRFAKVGQCVRNDAPAGARPKLLITACAPKTYEVLRRFDGATSGEKDAEAKCARVENYTDWYFYNSELDTLDFVLCLKLR